MVSRATRPAQDNKNILHAIVQRPEVSEVWIYAEHLLYEVLIYVEQLSSESIIKGDPADFLTNECKNCFIIVVTIAKE